jgi:hypothetical protein
MGNSPTTHNSFKIIISLSEQFRSQFVSDLTVWWTQILTVSQLQAPIMSPIQTTIHSLLNTTSVWLLFDCPYSLPVRQCYQIFIQIINKCKLRLHPTHSADRQRNYHLQPFNCNRMGPNEWRWVTLHTQWN